MMKTENTSEFRLLVENTLSPGRFMHVCGVVAMAKELALLHGEDINRAEIAAWLHDIAREWEEKRLQNVARIAGVPDEFWGIPELLHGPVAAYVGGVEYGINDEGILNAVFYHTTGRPDMTLLEKILFVADAIEPGRTYPNVEQIRTLAKERLDSAVLASLDSTITFLIRTGQPIGTLTIMARNSLLNKT